MKLASLRTLGAEIPLGWRRVKTGRIHVGDRYWCHGDTRSDQKFKPTNEYHWDDTVNAFYCIIRRITPSKET